MDNRKEPLFLGKVKKNPKQSTELTRGQRPRDDDDDDADFQSVAAEVVKKKIIH